MTPSDPSVGDSTRSLPGPLRVAWAPMLAVTVVLSVVAGRYGPHWDELYFRMLPVRWWYVDQPPLTVWLSGLAGQLSDALWVQRVPAIAAAAAGALVAGLFPRLLGAAPPVQRLAAWAHAFTVYPLLMGHIFTTATLDLLAWEVIIYLTLRATVKGGQSLVWAGAVAGVACWNKLLVVVLVLALLIGLLATDRRVLWTRQALWGGCLFALLGAPQVLAQLVHGLPMAEVSAGLVEQQGTLVRIVLLPALALFLGPPLLVVGMWGLSDPWRLPGRPGRLLLPTVAVLVVWTLFSPSQPYYPAAALLPALSMGFASPHLRQRWSVRRVRLIVAANSVVASLICLPLLPAAGPWTSWISPLNPTIRDQLGWDDYARQISAARHPDEDVVTDLYSLAGAVHFYEADDQSGAGSDRRAYGVHSGQNAMWELGPPTSDAVLLVGSHAVAQRASFRSCSSAGNLRTRPVAHRQLESVPMLHCEGPRTDWATLWPAFRTITG